MIEELRRIETELDSNNTNLVLLERYIVLSQRLGRDFLKDWFPLDLEYIEFFFQQNKNLMEKYIEIQNRYDFGYPAWNAYAMVVSFGSGRKWAKHIIENCQIGDPAYAAYLMHYGPDRSWTENIIEHAEIGNPAGAASYMVLNCESDRSWAKNIIENAKIGYPAKAAYWMVRYCGADRSWAEKVIEHTEIGDPAYTAYLMVEYCGSSQEWADKVVESWEGRND